MSHNMKMYGIVKIKHHTFKIPVVDRGEWPASNSGRFFSYETANGTHSIPGWLGPRGGLYMVAERKIPALAANRTPVSPSVASHFTD